MQPSGANYPATFTFDPPERVDNWRPLVQWLLAFPHFIVLYGLRIVSQVLSVLSWFVILFTGNMPEAFANFQAMYVRYSMRTYLYAGFLRSEYPPFTFATAPADPGDDGRVRVDVVPELVNRNRVTVAFRLILAIPQFVAVALLGIATSVVVVIAFFAVLFTGRWPEGMRAFVIKVARYSLRVSAYTLLLTDVYPPFALS